MIRKIITYIVHYGITFYALTWRIKFHNHDEFEKMVKEGKSPVMALWHNQLLPLTFSHRNLNVSTIASDSKDGDMIAFALTHWGYKPARGSSSKGGIKAALKAIKLALANKTPCAVTVDGPRGPSHVVKTGAVFIAKKLNGGIIIAAMNTKHFIRFKKSWDKFILPLPFAKVDVIFSDTIYFDDKTDEEALNRDTETLQKLMTDFTNANCSFLL